MENSIDNSHASETSKKSRSLDLRSLYVDKTEVSVRKEGPAGGVLKRKRQELVDNELDIGQGKKKRKSRKEVSLSSFEPFNKNRKVLDSVQGNCLNYGSPDSNNSNSKLRKLLLGPKNQAKKKNTQLLGNGDIQTLSSLGNISHKLDDNIPKRPRGLLRRKKFQNNHDLDQVGVSSSTVSFDAQKFELNGNSVKIIPSCEGKLKKALGDLKENSSSRANPARFVKLDDISALRYNGNPSPKRVHKYQGKRWESAPEKQNHIADNSDKISEDLQEDDEENLEQNAARMLSSRFDPRCTGFSGDSKALSALQSMDGLSFVPSDHQDFDSCGANHSGGSESTSADAAGRVLRPRKQHKEKGITRKRRHFYEIFFGDLDAYWVLNRRIKVFWPLDKSWYFGIVDKYDPERKLHHVKYDDRDEEWIDLQKERFKLLLLPSEIPGKSGPQKSVQRDKCVHEEDVNPENDNCIGSYMDSEPIISWLARSTRRVKSSPLGVLKRQRTSCPSEKQVLPIADDSAGPPPYRNELFRNSVLPDRLFHGELAEKTTASTTCSNDRRLPLVYFRRRFHKKGQGLGCRSEETPGYRSAGGSASSLASVVDWVGALDKHDVALQVTGFKDLRPLGHDSILWSDENVGLLKLTDPLLKLKQVKLRLSFFPRWIHILSFEAEKNWLFRTVMLLHYGAIMTLWPKVNLEMLFVDNVVGLRFILFEGCLMQAVAFICLVLTVFHQSNEYGNCVDLQLPATSIRFKLSGFQDLGRHFVFVVYNFLEVEVSKWLYLDSKLKKYCLISKQLPLPECTYDNIKVLQNGSAWLRVPSICEGPISHEGVRKRSRHAILQMGISKELARIDLSCSDSNSNGKHWRLPSFVLSFAAAPTFFLSLHLKLLMENNVASMSFQNLNSMALLRSVDCGNLACDDSSGVEDIPNQVPKIAIENNSGSTLNPAARCRQLSSTKLEVETDALSIRNDGDWIEPSQICLNGELNVTGTSVGPKGSGKNEIDGTIGMQGHLCHHAGSELLAERSWPSVMEDHSSPDKTESRCFSSLGGVDIQIPYTGQVESQPFDGGMQNNHQSTSGSTWIMNDFGIQSPNPTAPRSVWNRNRHSIGSPSLGYHSKVWPDGKADFVLNGFGNGSRKPRTQFSCLLPFRGHEFGSKPRSHHRKGRPHKGIKTDDEKRMSGGSRSPKRHPELLSCDANVLITVGDRGWRECGAQVVLEFVDHKDWRLLVKLSGATRYSYKAHQFLQPGTTNRYTHAMMWKGGKDWILEFSERSQWALFREMHEECYNRNIRAASIKNIPIPGVCLIEDGDDNAIEVPFIRSSSKYFRQVETEVDMAMNPSHVLYDMESDDEDWISKQRSSLDVDGSNLPEISDETFEKIMDMFEKIAYARKCDNFSSEEIEELMVGVGPVDVIKAIYKHWQQKRQRKGMPLIRQFQPPLWEKYQKEVKEWELAINKIHLPNGGKEKAAIIEKPPMFAFCMRPRGLEVPNKGSKQRSQRKVPVGGHNNAFSKDHDGLQVLGRKLNGFSFGEERVVVIGQNHESSDSSPWIQTRVLSPRDAVSISYSSMSSDISERNHHPKLHRNKSKRAGTFLVPGDSQMKSYDQRITDKRNGVNRWSMGFPEWPSQKQYQPEASQRRRVEQLSASDLDEFRLRDASGAAQHAFNMAKLKREKAQRLLYRADLAIHKAVLALMTAEAIKASSEKESTDDG
ncbi:PREDICTED: uncharacterized protein LOC104595249 isoform X2 [Nelumbo nucifera]|uniref:Enhancer of polycomb-like protein n=1 Tax=Nelumbo nucifera TaxID=4432 RepID=A0A1U7ZZN7_NELNU|nr:PREDICTED: uncharacterized protein LOC104595249 isoform X2 [Nelumbo nucifera]